jgi:hypothetical protein
LVEAAVHASWRMERSRRAETAALTRQVLAAEEGFDDRQAEEVRFLTEGLANSPALVVRKLQNLVSARP